MNNEKTKNHKENEKIKISQLLATPTSKRHLYNNSRTLVIQSVSDIVKEGKKTLY